MSSSVFAEEDAVALGGGFEGNLGLGGSLGCGLGPGQAFNNGPGRTEPKLVSRLTGAATVEVDRMRSLLS